MVDKTISAASGNLTAAGSLGFDIFAIVVSARAGKTSVGGSGAIEGKAVVNSPVQRAMQTLNEIKANGGTVKVNPMSPGQELNMTIREGARKLDLRIETHKLPAKYGGDGVNPTRHMNVDMKGANLPNKGHVKL